MRTTVDLPPALHRRVSELAVRRGRSLSATIAELTGRAMDELDSMGAVEPLESDTRTGLPLLRSRRAMTVGDVEQFLDEDE